jgi:hypothetical protein
MDIFAVLKMKIDMRNFLTVILLLLMIGVSYGQEAKVEDKPENYIEFGADPSFLVGQEANGYVDWVVKFGSEFGDYGNIAVFYERADMKNYVSYGIQPGLVIPIVYGLRAKVGTELSMIERYDLEEVGILYTRKSRTYDPTYAFNIGLDYRFHKNVALGYSADFKRRPDISSSKWEESFRVGLTLYFL